MAFCGVGPADLTKAWKEGTWFCCISYKARRELVSDDHDVCLTGGGRKGIGHDEWKSREMYYSGTGDVAKDWVSNQEHACQLHLTSAHKGKVALLSMNFSVIVKFKAQDKGMEYQRHHLVSALRQTILL